MPSKGFAPQLNPGSLRLVGKPLPFDYRRAITDCILQRTLMGSSTVTLQFTDPHRILAKDLEAKNTVKDGDILTVEGLKYAFVQHVKASDQLQLVFESDLIHKLSNDRGSIKIASGTNVTAFIGGLIARVGGHLVAPDYATIWSKIDPKVKIQPIGLGRGTPTDPKEDSWTAISRICAGIGWRLWEYDNTVYAGPDEFWLGKLTPLPPINQRVHRTGKKMHVLREFTREVQLMDYDWDTGKPLGELSATVMLDSFDYEIGEIVRIANLGIATGEWMVYSMQRDLFLPNGMLTLQVPMPFPEVYKPDNAPLLPHPLV